MQRERERERKHQGERERERAHTRMDIVNGQYVRVFCIAKINAGVYMHTQILKIHARIHHEHHVCVHEDIHANDVGKINVTYLQWPKRRMTRTSLAMKPVA